MQLLEFDIIVIGGGCIGSSILYELCQRGFNDIALIDSGRKTTSATAHSGGMLRVFHESLDHVKMALSNSVRVAAYKNTRVLSEKNEANGSLYFFNKSRYSDYINNLKIMTDASYPFDILTERTGPTKFPQYHFGNQWAIYEPLGGSLSPRTFVDDLLLASTQCGATLLDDYIVDNISFEKKQYYIKSKDVVITSRILILAGGAALLPRLTDLNVTLDVNIKTITTHVAEKSDPDYIIPNYFDRESLHFAIFNNTKEVILSHKSNRHLLEKKWGHIQNMKSAEDIYVNNRQGYLGAVAGFSNLYLATGWGGTGFKFALEVGHRIVNIIDHCAKKEAH